MKLMALRFSSFLSRLVNAGRRQEKAAPPVMAEQERLFMLSSRLLASEQGDHLTEPYRQHGWVYSYVRAIAQNLAGISLLT